MTFLFRLHLLTYLVSMWAFLALVFTGQLHAPAIVAFVFFWMFAVMRDRELWRDAQGSSWAQIHQAVSFSIPSWLWTLVTLIAFGLGIYGWFGLTERMYAVTYFFLFLEINKLLTANTNRDLLQIYALTFFHMLAASVSTDSFIFAPMLAGYLFLILQALTTFTIKRDVEGVLAEQQIRENLSLENFSHSAPYRLKTSDSDALSRVAYDRIDFRGLGLLIQRNFALLSLGILILGMGVFWIVPRTAKQNFFNPGLRSGASSQRISGYADEISFGGLGQIQNDPTIVMRAQPLKGYLETRPQFLRIRGTALDRFTGREWSKSDRLISGQQLISRIQDVSFADRSVDPRFDKIFKARVTLEPTSTNYFFLLDQPLSIHLQSPASVQKDPGAQSLRVDSERFETISYEADAIVLDRSRYLEEVAAGNVEEKEELSLQSADLSTIIGQVAREIYTNPANNGITREASFREARKIVEDHFSSNITRNQEESTRSLSQYTQFPVSIPEQEINTLAVDWTQGAASPAEQAVALEQYLKNEFSYTLDITYSNREDHVMHFLTETRSGHCEYFATSMVLLLRSLGIPARIVNGYLTDEWNDNQERFIVRQEHAHSWVEAQVGPDARWVTFDPTPEDGIGSNRINISWYHRFSSAFDGVRMWWYNNVVDYNEEDQRRGIGFIFGLLRQISINSNEGMNSFQSLFNKGQNEAGNASRWLMIAAGAVALLLALTFAYVFIKQRRTHRHTQGLLFTDRSLREDLLPFRNFMLELQKHHPKIPGQTPLAYIQTLSQTTLPELRELIPITKKYYEARYGDLYWTKQELDQLQQVRTTVEESLKNTS